MCVEVLLQKINKLKKILVFQAAAKKHSNTADILPCCLAAMSVCQRGSMYGQGPTDGGHRDGERKAWQAAAVGKAGRGTYMKGARPHDDRVRG